MTLYYHLDGELTPAEDATVSVRDRGFSYGDAAFETLRAYGGTVFEWNAHANRLRDTASVLGMADAVPPSADLRARVRETLAANDLEDAYVRLSVTRGVQPGKLTPRSPVDPTVVVVVKELPRGGRDGTPVWDGPAVVSTVETRRVPDEAIPAGAKTHNYLNGVLARLELRHEANESGTAPADEALLRDGEGFLAEGTTSNVFFASEGVLHTPSTDGPILPGITRSVVCDLAREAGVPVETGRYTISDLREADEAFLTNTTWEVRPVASIDEAGFEDPPGAVTERLQGAFRALVQDRHY